MICLWKSHNLDKRALDTYLRMTVNKSIDECIFTLSQAMNLDLLAVGDVKMVTKAQM